MDRLPIRTFKKRNVNFFGILHKSTGRLELSVCVVSDVAKCIYKHNTWKATERWIWVFPWLFCGWKETTRRIDVFIDPFWACIEYTQCTFNRSHQWTVCSQTIHTSAGINHPYVKISLLSLLLPELKIPVCTWTFIWTSTISLKVINTFQVSDAKCIHWLLLHVPDILSTWTCLERSMGVRPGVLSRSFKAQQRNHFCILNRDVSYFPWKPLLLLL